jgi:hypothetical protein
MLRVDLTAVAWIDPAAFVDLARALNAWRDEFYGRVVIQFPDRRTRARSCQTSYPSPTAGPTFAAAALDRLADWRDAVTVC